MKIFETLAAAGAGRVILLSDPPSGLKAIVAIDSVALGPAAGGIRTMAYPCFEAALADAQNLASAMTLKCAIAGLDAGGAKTVVIDHPGLDRPAAFRRLGAFIEDLSGLYWAGGDLGTTRADLEAAASKTSFVNVEGAALAASTGQTIVNGIRACAMLHGRADLRGLRVAIQGCGHIGSAVAKALVAEAAILSVSDVSNERARHLAAETGATVIPPDQILKIPVDILSPCAVGQVISCETIKDIKAWGICGGANNQLEDPAVTGQALLDADILFVPDFLASSGGVISGIAGPVMNVDDGPLLAETFNTAEEVLATARRTGVATNVVAEQMAQARLDLALSKAMS